MWTIKWSCLSGHFFLILILLFAGLSSKSAEYIKNGLPTVSLRLNAPLSYRQIEKISEFLPGNALGISQISYWTQSDSFAKSKNTPTTKECVLLECAGDGSLVFPQKFMRGSYPNPLDNKGCAISSGLADILFGSTNVIGLSIKVAETDFIIRGIWDESESVALVQRDPSKEIGFTNVELMLTDQKDGRETALDFTRKNRIEPISIVNGPGISMITSFVSNFPLYILGFLLIARIIIQIWRKKELKTRFCFVLLFLLAVFLLFGWGAKIPDYLIPTKWSDFSYWSRLLKDYQIRGLELLSLTPTLKDVYFRIAALHLLGILIAALTSVTAYFGVCFNPKSTFNHPTIQTLCTVHCIFFGIVLLLMGTLPINVRLFYIPCFYLIIRRFSSASYDEQMILISNGNSHDLLSWTN